MRVLTFLPRCAGALLVVELVERVVLVVREEDEVRLAPDVGLLAVVLVEREAVLLVGRAGRAVLLRVVVERVLRDDERTPRRGVRFVSAIYCLLI